MYKSIVAISVILLIACGSSKYKYATEEELQQYTGPYYVTFDFFPKNSHPMVMGGIGETFDIRLLKKNNLKDFTESFYKQFAYAPHIMDLEYDYKKTLSCLGYDITWYKRYYIADIISNVIEDIRLKLKDGNYIIIRKYRILGDLDVKYIGDFKDCIKSTSIELDINKIKAIDKVAILLDNE